MAFYVPTRFLWRFGGSQVHLCGSFTRWVETVPMTPVEGQPGAFSVIVQLPAGYHQYKFIVDGEWRHDETQPFMPDPLGNVNNWLFVRRPDTAPSIPPAAPRVAAGSPVHLAPPSPSASASPHPLARPAHPSPAYQAPSSPHPIQQQQQQQRVFEAPAVASPPSRHGSGVVDPGDVLAARRAATADGDVRAPPPGPPPAVGAGVPAPAHPGPGPMADAEEPAHTSRSIHDFLGSHTAYELILESGKVVLLDVDLPMRQALHALHEQGIASAPLWDSQVGAVVGVVSASDFIFMLQRLRHVVSASAALSEAEMDGYTIRAVRDELAAESRAPRALVSARPADSLAEVVRTLVAARCHLLPVLGEDAGGGGGACEVLATASLAGVLACVLRHFRASAASLPLLGRSLREVAIGTTALRLLLETGVSCLPVVDDARTLLDVYARADICMLAKGNAYSRLQQEDVTVGQALTLASAPTAPTQVSAWSQQSQHLGPKQRVWICTADDSLRTVVERLAVPGVRRLVVVDGTTHRVEGIVSLSDVATFLMV
ncbi:5'-AMP-activated protein kinase subunit gamma-1 [Auxenochlorella protothecoides]|uniref:5'-AMP-activated protein kinase subunit gamma-1 n=1 Tax=Auxenochlorella protothecoides TaxID=3075 RepID=A0A087SMG3_AUXPR|nr:5'-AMP-activated protein kinase subunit gamma-1 [Auxenochlorella protothecoides]KFM26917.1 5'-AMP-activated protein kinase subunit gamma-1 [Auxenochlorella protothecoides]